jgi:hypothetical protein
MSFSVDDLVEATRKQLAPVEVELSDGSKVKLSALLRLKKEERKAVSDSLKIIGETNDDDDDTEGLEQIAEEVSKILRVIADKPAKLLKELDDPDLLVKVSVLTSVVTKWAAETKLGEAGNSPAS